MMKNYFESEKVIVSFEKALYVLIDEKNRLFVCVEKGLLLEFPIGNWNFYKAWLDSRANPSEIPTSCTCSEKANDINHLPDAGKVVLSRDMLQEIVDKVGCRYCTVDHLSQDCKNCYSYSNIKISDDFVEKINKLINEEGK